MYGPATGLLERVAVGPCKPLALILGCESVGAFWRWRSVTVTPPCLVESRATGSQLLL